MTMLDDWARDAARRQQSLDQANLKAEDEARKGITNINPVTGQPWKSTAGTLQLGSPIAQFEMANAIVANAAATNTNATNEYKQILADIDRYGVQVDKVWNDLSTEVKGILAESAAKQRAEIETGYGEAKGLLTKEIEDLTADYEKALGYYDSLLETGIADPQGRIRQIRGELETNFKAYLTDVMDQVTRKGTAGRTMLSSLPKTQEAFFKSLAPLVGQQQEAAYGAAERITGQQAGLQTGMAGARGAITGQMANLETWKGSSLANIEGQQGTAKANLAGQVAGGKAGGLKDVMAGRTSVAENILKQSTALPYLQSSQLLSSIGKFQQPELGTTTTKINPAIPSGTTSALPVNSYDQWQKDVQAERTAPLGAGATISDAAQRQKWVNYYS